MKLTFEHFSKNLSRKFKLHWNLTWITGTLHINVCTFTTTRWFFCEKCFRQKSCRKNPNTHLVFNDLYSENLEEYDTSRQATDNNIAWHMHFACWIRQEYAQGKNMHTHPEYAILTAFPRQQRLRERSPMLRYTYIACLVILHQILLWSLNKGGQ